jgi:outer membrane lipoprotein-sorting protein
MPYYRGMTIAMNPLLSALFILGLGAAPLYAEEMTIDVPAETVHDIAVEEDAEVGINADALKKAARDDKPIIKQKLDAEDRTQLKRLEVYFNSIRTMKANFVQTLADGRMAKGTIALSRPGKMRLAYAPPNKDMLVADGLFVHVWDSQAKTSSSVPLGTSLADVILRDHFTFDGDIAVTEVRYYPSMMEVVIVQKENPDSGSLTLEFQDNPLKLRNWRVTDIQGMETRVSLSNDEVNGKIPSSTFYYRDPEFGKPKK